MKWPVLKELIRITLVLAIFFATTYFMCTVIGFPKTQTFCFSALSTVLVLFLGYWSATAEINNREERPHE